MFVLTVQKEVAVEVSRARSPKLLAAARLLTSGDDCNCMIGTSRSLFVDTADCICSFIFLVGWKHNQLLACHWQCKVCIKNSLEGKSPPNKIGLVIHWNGSRFLSVAPGIWREQPKVLPDICLGVWVLMNSGVSDYSYNLTFVSGSLIGVCCLTYMCFSNCWCFTTVSYQVLWSLSFKPSMQDMPSNETKPMIDAQRDDQGEWNFPWALLWGEMMV